VDVTRGRLRLGDLLFFPEDLVELQALDAYLTAPMEAFSYPHHACPRALHAPLQQDLISRMEMMPCGVDARSRRRNVKRADVGRASRSKKVDSERDDYRAALFAQLIKIFQLQLGRLFTEWLEDCAHNSDSSTNFCAISLRIFA